MSISLVLVLALSATAFARPVDQTSQLEKFIFHDLQGPANTSSPGVFNAAQGGTTYFGGTVWASDSLRWEAIVGGTWTFDSGVGSFILQDAGDGTPVIPSFYDGAINPYKLPGLHGGLEGWTGFDNSYSEITFFRRLQESDFTGTPCVGAGAGLQGTWSFWCGALTAEAEAACFAAGRGYGDGWVVCIGQTFNYSGGPVTWSYSFVNDTEPGFDFTYVYVDTTGDGDDVEAAVYDGFVSGTETLNLTAGLELPSTPGPVIFKYCFVSDTAYSDQDGSYPTDCGAFAVDVISITGGGINHAADFEAGPGGWALLPPAAGAGGEWAEIVALGDLPPTLTTCECDLADSVLVFNDLTGGPNPHGLFQDNLAASPWIDLRRAGLVGVPGKFIQFNGYFELPLLNYIFVQTNVQWYPEVCVETGKLIMSTFQSDGFIRYFGGVPVCTSPVGLPTRLNYGTVAAAGAEQMRIAIGVLSYCRFFANCTGVSNSTPWFDYARLGVFGAPGAPLIGSRTIDHPQDAFPTDGSLQIGSAGRWDVNNVKGEASPEPGSALGDTSVVQGATGGAEVWVQFKVTPGPGTNASLLADFLAKCDPATVQHGETGWYEARMDTAEQGGIPSGGSWMTAFHEASSARTTGPLVGVADNDIDPDDPGHIATDIFPDHVFTPGTRVNLFYKSRFTGESVWFTFPDTTGLYLDQTPDSPTSLAPPGVGSHREWECLPSSFDTDSTWNCVLYVDHFSGRGAQLGFIENGLLSLLGTGSANYEGVNWDRWDVEAPSSQQGSFGGPLNTDYGASQAQVFAYKAIIWNSGNLNAFNVIKEDADILIPWLSLPDAALNGNNLYLSGDGIAASMNLEGASEPSARQLLEDYCAVLWQCNTFRDPGCPTGSPLDETVCLNVVPQPGAVVAGTRGVAHLAQGNGCPTQRSFDVLARNTGVPNAAADVIGDEAFVGGAKTAQYASVSRNRNAGQEIWRTVVDGMSVHYRRDSPPGTTADCTFGGASTAVTERLSEVLTWFGFIGGATCDDPTAGVGVEDPFHREPSFRTTLANFAPNPLMGGATGRIQFTMEREGRAAVDIFDVNGRLVKSVFDGIALEGPNEASWNGTDGTGRSVSSGVYFIRLKALDQTHQTKMVLIENGGR